jgi:zinc/manganese transport system substrate-binding protein
MRFLTLPTAGFTPLLVVTLLLAGCSATATPAVKDGVVQVVAIENVWGDIAAQIGGTHVKVTSILKDPGTDPHTFETDPATASAVGGAAFVIENGAGYDDFADKLLDASPRKDREVLSIAKLVGAASGTSNPHLWYSPTYVTKAARTIADRLAAAAPSARASFDAGLASFLASYQRYADVLEQIKATYAGAPVGYTERVPGYLVEAAGLRLATPASFSQSVEDGNDPSPADVQAVDDAMTGRTVKVLLYNAQVTSPVTAKVQQLARAAGVPVVGVSETIPAGAKDFQDWQLTQAQAVLAALGG